jgi:predicted CXXCH cytochrome family protein
VKEPGSGGRPRRPPFDIPRAASYKQDNQILISGTRMRLTISLLLLLAGAAWTAEKDTCFECHVVMEGMSDPFKEFDIHYKQKLSCADCHGGDQFEEEQNLSMHASRGFKVRVDRPGVPEYCGHCHADPAIMHKYAPKQKTDQLAKYKTSVHGKALAAGNRSAAQCIDCHEIHTIRQASEAEASTNPAKLAETCGKCHSATLAAFRKGPHASIFVSKDMPSCTACHDPHSTAPVSAAMLTGKTSVCAKCHEAASAGGKAAAEIGRLMAGAETAATKAVGAAARKAARENLQKARAAVHSSNVATVKQAVAGGTTAGAR